MTKRTVLNRPFGVSVIVILQLITLISLTIDFYLDGRITAVRILPKLQETQLFLFLGIALILYQLVLALGLWQLKRWAWFLIMIQLGIAMSVGLWFYFDGTPLYYYMVFNVIMVFYLNQRDVQRAFEKRAEADEETPWTT